MDTNGRAKKAYIKYIVNYALKTCHTCIFMDYYVFLDIYERIEWLLGTGLQMNVSIRTICDCMATIVSCTQT